MTEQTSAEWRQDLRTLAAELAALADEPATDVARQLGPLLARGIGVEKRVSRVRIAALREVVDTLGSQRAASQATGIEQGNISRILSGLASPEVRARAGQAR